MAFKSQIMHSYECLRELNSTEPEDFEAYLRTDDAAFSILLILVGPRIEKQDTRMTKVSLTQKNAWLRFLLFGFITFLNSLLKMLLKY